MGPALGVLEVALVAPSYILKRSGAVAGAPFALLLREAGEAVLAFGERLAFVSASLGGGQIDAFLEVGRAAAAVFAAAAAAVAVVALSSCLSSRMYRRRPCSSVIS